MDGTWPVGTAQWEKRNIAIRNSRVGRGAVHPVQQVRVGLSARGNSREGVRSRLLAGAPATFKSVPYKGHGSHGKLYACRSRPEDCTGCMLCVAVCPAKDKSDPARKALEMAPQAPLRDPERANYDFFLNLPEADRLEDRAMT